VSGTRDFLLSKSPQRHQDLPGLLFTGHLGSSPGIKWLGCEIHHPPPSSAEGKNTKSYTSTPCICLCGVDRDNVTFYLSLEPLKLPSHEHIKRV
jgi:hypothetical protein